MVEIWPYAYQSLKGILRSKNSALIINDRGITVSIIAFDGAFILAMPAARAIRYKSGLTPASALRAFRFYPYCISYAAATHIVRPRIPPTSKACQRVSLPQPSGR